MIADLGLAVRYEGKTGLLDFPANEKAGTVRYLAPEVLNKNLNLRNFESLKSVDVYALGLTMWEICHRCRICGKSWLILTCVFPRYGLILVLDVQCMW